jgi:chemotaxis response regulator CheB
MVFVVIHHLRREHPTALVSILSQCTKMPVQLAADNLLLYPNHVYILPSGEEITLKDGSFAMHSRSKVRGWPNLVSLFVDSMSRSQHPGIVIILSGMDSNGTEALIRLKKHGGIVIAQTPDTAAFPDMPRAAIRTGAVDFVLDPAKIGATLSEMAVA